VLANAVFRNNEGAKSGLLLRSFLINKVPLLLASLSSSPYALNSSFPQYNSGFCITQALNRVDTSVFPTMSNMFDVSNNHNAFTETVRQEFCFACLLHGLISKEATDELLGEITFQDLPAGGRYVKDNLVQQCLADPERLQKLIVELEGMDGNAGAACQALAEVSFAIPIPAKHPQTNLCRQKVMGQLCRNKETMALKQLCSQLARKPLYLDVMLLFNKAETILQPLCELLDNWRYDDDQGEYQPVYEEFGSILLLVLAFAYRYGLSPADLKISSADSFVAKLLTQGQLARPLEELSEQESAHIGGWVSGLFDSEAGGLGDELMSSCPPQDFYLLIPTLFQQIVLAFSVGRLTEEMLKGGLECK
jgi:mediator of RNA polymerase II transcription subunit 5